MNTSLDDLLLDLHLDRLDDAERNRLTGRLACDERLAARCHALGRVLRPLDAYGAVPVPATLADRIIAASGAASRALSEGRNEASTGPNHHDGRDDPPPRPVRMSACAEPGAAGGGRRLTLRDLAALAACIVMILFIVIPGAARLREEGRRTSCGDNFGAIYRAVTAYGQTFDDNLPQAEFIKGGSWLYSGPSDAPRASNSRHAFLLTKLGFAPDPSAFVCPSSLTAPPEALRDLTDAVDFPGPGHCTYDTLNMNGPTPRLSADNAITYASDPNPLFVDGYYNPAVNPNTTNTPLHKGEGQNVLSLDGQVRWVTSPFVNRRDNMWLAGDRQVYRGTETQATPDDAFLVPGTPSRQTPAPERDEPEELADDDRQ